MAKWTWEDFWRFREAADPANAQRADWQLGFDIHNGELRISEDFTRYVDRLNIKDLEAFLTCAPTEIVMSYIARLPELSARRVAQHVKPTDLERLSRLYYRKRLTAPR